MSSDPPQGWQKELGMCGQEPGLLSLASGW